MQIQRTLNKILSQIYKINNQHFDSPSYAFIPTDKSDKEKLYRATERISVVHQMENLLTFPDVERKIKDGTLQIHGWYYRIEDGTLESYDGEQCSFLPLVENDSE